MDELLKVGDLVSYPDKGVFHDYYKNNYKTPGIILNVVERLIGDGSRHSYEIIWSNGKVTIEHASYIRKLE